MYNHKPNSPSLPVFLDKPEHIQKLQLIVAPTPSAAVSYEGLMIQAHICVFTKVQEAGEIAFRNSTENGMKSWLTTHRGLANNSGKGLRYFISHK